LEVLDVNKLFQPFVAKWLEGVADQLPAWVDKAVREEDVRTPTAQFPFYCP